MVIRKSYTGDQLEKMNDDELQAAVVNADLFARIEPETKRRIIAALKRGDAFDKLAKEKSKDTGSKDNGGDLDWGPAGRYVPEFGNAMKALAKCLPA